MVLFYRVIGSLAGLSMMGSFLIIMTAFLFRQLRTHPYSLVMWLSICDFFFSLKYVVIAILPHSATINSNWTFCKTTALYTNFFALASVSWSAVLSFNLIYNTARPFGDSSGFTKWYHLFVWFISGLSTLLVGLSDDIGISDDGTCWFALQKTFHWQFYVPLGCYFLLALGATVFSIFRAWHFSSGATRYAVKLIFRMTLYVGVFIASWLGPTVNEIYTSVHETAEIPRRIPPAGFSPDTKFAWWTGVSVALVGFLNAIIWLSNPAIYHLIKTKIVLRYCTCWYNRAERIPLIGKLESMLFEDQDSDIHRLNIVFRNNAIACLLLGIRFSLSQISTTYDDLSESVRFNTTLTRAGRPPRDLPPKLAQKYGSMTASQHNALATSNKPNDAHVVPLDEEESTRVTAGWSEPRVSSAHAIPADSLEKGERRRRKRLEYDPTSSGDEGPSFLDQSSSDINGDLAEEAYAPDDQLHILSNLDFEHVAKLDLSPENLEILDVPDLFTSPFSFQDFAPHVFHNIRVRFGFKSEEYYNSLAPGPFLTAVLENAGFSSGRSGAFMCFSPNRRFLIKTIPDHEAKTMQRILPAYYAHLETNPQTLLSPIIGLYSLRLSGAPTLNIIVMSNLFSHELITPSIVYDLKGSWVDRGGKTTRGTRKDNDLQTPFNIPYQDSSQIFRQLDRDSKMLAEQGVMDYSLLVGVRDAIASRSSNSYIPPRRKRNTRASAPATDTSISHGSLGSFGSPSSAASMDTVEEPEAINPHAHTVIPDPYVKDMKGTRSVAKIVHSTDQQQIYIIGIIDMLQSYNLSKKIERLIKVYFRCKSGDGLSATNPTRYQLRFRTSMAHNIGFTDNPDEVV